MGKAILSDFKGILQTDLYKAEPKDRGLEETQAARRCISAPLVHELHKHLTSWSKHPSP